MFLFDVSEADAAGADAEGEGSGRQARRTCISKGSHVVGGGLEHAHLPVANDDLDGAGQLLIREAGAWFEGEGAPRVQHAAVPVVSLQWLQISLHQRLPRQPCPIKDPPQASARYCTFVACLHAVCRCCTETPNMCSDWHHAPRLAVGYTVTGAGGCTVTGAVGCTVTGAVGYP